MRHLKRYMTFMEGKKTYEALRIKKALEIKYNICMNHKKIRRIMRKYGLVVKYMRVFKKKTRQIVSKENIRPNVLNRNFEAKKINEKWVTDIIYLIAQGKKKYLCSILLFYRFRCFVFYCFVYLLFYLFIFIRFFCTIFIFYLSNFKANSFQPNRLPFSISFCLYRLTFVFLQIRIQFRPRNLFQKVW